MYSDLHMFDKAQFGVVLSDETGRVSYANEWMSRLLGPRLTTDSKIRDFITDPDSLGTLEEEIRKRGRGSPGEYVLTIDAAARPMQIQVFSTPLIDAAGAVRGAVAFVTKASLDRLRDALLSISVSSTAPLESIAQLRDVLLRAKIQFDALTVAMYDANMSYSRVIYTWFSEAPHDTGRWTKHWVKLTPAQRTWILESTAADRAIPNIEEFLQRPEWRNIRGNPLVMALKAMQMRSAAGVLVKDGMVNVATLSLLSKREGVYDEDFVRELHDLPIDRCVLSAVNAIRGAETAFRYKLLRRLARCNTIDELGNSVVNLLCRQYKLARVALYSIEWVDGCARLCAEKISGHPKRPSAAEVVPLRSGCIADAGRLIEPIYVEEIASHDYFEQYLHECKGSAYCWPVSYHREGGDKLVRWVFCAVDEHLDAFSPGERRMLDEIASDIGGLLQRLTELHFMKATFDTTTDAILVVDGRHQVRRANVAAAELFKRDGPRQVTGNVADFFRNPVKAAEFLHRPMCTMEAAMLDANGSSFPAMVSSRSLPASIGGKVFAFEDLTKIKRLQELSFLGQVATEIAAQIQTPLTLASSWVERIATHAASETGQECGGQHGGENLLDLADRTLMQLSRIQACLDRIALYDSKGEFVARPVIPLSLGAELLKAVRELPAFEQSRIVLPTLAHSVVVSAHPEHLGFVLDTLVAFFLRDLPSANQVTVSMGQGASHGWLKWEIPEMSTPAPRTAAQASRDTLMTQLGLVERGLRKILSAYHGSFEAERPRDGPFLVCAQIELPLCR